MASFSIHAFPGVSDPEDSSEFTVDTLPRYSSLMCAALGAVTLRYDVVREIGPGLLPLNVVLIRRSIRIEDQRN